MLGLGGGAAARADVVGQRLAAPSHRGAQVVAHLQRQRRPASNTGDFLSSNLRPWSFAVSTYRRVAREAGLWVVERKARTTWHGIRGAALTCVKEFPRAQQSASPTPSESGFSPHSSESPSPRCNVTPSKLDRAVQGSAGPGRARLLCPVAYRTHAQHGGGRTPKRTLRTVTLSRSGWRAAHHNRDLGNNTKNGTGRLASLTRRHAQIALPPSRMRTGRVNGVPPARRPGVWGGGHKPRVGRGGG